MSDNGSNRSVSDDELRERVNQYFRAEEVSAETVDAARKIAGRFLTAARLAYELAFHMRVEAAATVDDPMFLGEDHGFRAELALDAARARAFAGDLLVFDELAKSVALRMGLDFPVSFFGSASLAPNLLAPAKDFQLIYRDKSPEYFDRIAILFRRIADHLRADANRYDPRPRARALRQGDPLMGGRLPELKMKHLAKWAKANNVPWRRLGRVVADAKFPGEPDWYRKEQAVRLADAFRKKVAEETSPRP